MNTYGARSYQNINNQTGIEGASPYQLIKILMEGALTRIAMGKGHMERQEYDLKANTLGKAIAIIGALKDSLNHDVSTDMTSNLEALYDYMIRRIFEASKDNDADMLDEVCDLLNEIKEAWNQIEPENPSTNTPSSTEDTVYQNIRA